MNHATDDDTVIPTLAASKGLPPSMASENHAIQPRHSHSQKSPQPQAQVQAPYQVVVPWISKPVVSAPEDEGGIELLPPERPVPRFKLPVRSAEWLARANAIVAAMKDKEEELAMGEGVQWLVDNIAAPLDILRQRFPDVDFTKLITMRAAAATSQSSVEAAPEKLEQRISVMAQEHARFIEKQDHEVKVAALRQQLDTISCQDARSNEVVDGVVKERNPAEGALVEEDEWHLL
jgi:hypothetical protein